MELAGNPVTSPTLTSSIISLLAQLGRVFLCTCGNAIGAFFSCYEIYSKNGCLMLCIFFQLFCFPVSLLFFTYIELFVPFYMEFTSFTHQLICFGAGFLSQMYSHILPDICPGIITDSRFIFGIHQQLLFKKLL